MSWNRLVSAVGGVVTACAVAAGGMVIAPAPAHAQVPDLATIIPGAPALPDIPGMPGAAGGDGVRAAVDLASQSPMFGAVMAHAESTTPNPETEVSTNPTCAPLMMVAVPGTFEINRDHNPNEPVGLLASLAEPLRALGPGFSETYINYAGDAGLSGTAYAQSVQGGVEKTLATIVDIQQRCDGARVVLSGFSQGADIAGDVATLIGNQQTAISVDTMAGVVLFADPQRDENANVLVGTSQETPSLPGVVGDAVEKFIADPSLAQLQMTANDVSGIARQLLSGDMGDAGEAGSAEAPKTTAPQAGEDDVHTQARAPKQEWKSQVDVPVGGFVGADKSRVFTAAQSSTTQEVTENDQDATGETVAEEADNPTVKITPVVNSGPPVGEIPVEDRYDVTDDEETRAAAGGVIVPGSLTSHRPAVYLELSDAEKGNMVLGHGHVWATEANLTAMDEFNDEYLEATGEEAPAPLREGTQESVQSVITTDIDLHQTVGKIYRAGLCEAQTFEECVSFYSGTAGLAAVFHQVQSLPEQNPEALASIPEGNLMETRCATENAVTCAATATPQERTLPTAQMTKISVGDVEKSVELKEGEAGAEKSATASRPAPADGDEPAASDRDEAAAATSAAALAGEGERPAGEDGAEGSASAVAGEDTRPTSAQPSTEKESAPETTKKAPQAGDDTRPTDAYTGTLGGATTGNKPETDGQGVAQVEGVAIDGIEPVTMAAVAGGGVAGPREQDFGALTGSVVSLCVPGDIVCSLPENSQLARDLVQVGQNVSTNLTGVAKAALEGNTRMGGLLAVEATSTIFQLSGLPPLKISAGSIMVLIQLVSGAAMMYAGDPTGAGIGMVTAALAQMPQVLPELWAQLQDLPAIIEALPHAADTFARNLGLDKILGRLSEGFGAAGMNDLTRLDQIPAAAVTLASDLLQENSGLMELATNPDYLKTGAHSEHGFRGILVSDTRESILWTQDWFGAVRKAMAAA